MSYKRKNGDVISRRDFQKISDKEVLKEFQPSHDAPNKSYDGEKFGELTVEQKAEEKKEEEKAEDATHDGEKED